MKAVADKLRIHPVHGPQLRLRCFGYDPEKQECHQSNRWVSLDDVL